MKKIFILLFFIGITYTMPGQSIISLEQAHALDVSGQDFPDELTYVKDVNNRLDSFVGIWKGNDNGRLYEIRFIKKIAYLRNAGGIAWDRLVGRILVKDSVSNDTIYNTLDVQDDYKTFFRGDNFCGAKVYCMDFYGPENGCYDSGDLSLILGDNAPTFMRMYYHRGGSDLIDPRTCPGGYENYRPILPKKLYLQKQ